MLTAILLVVCIAIAYALGSVCSAILVCKAANLPDPRKEGSQNPGATNVLRIAGKQYAALVLAADFLKGLIPVWLAALLHVNAFGQALVGLAAVIGHMYPIFFEFKGGKGVATTLGVLVGFNALLGLLALVTWVVVAVFSRYSSLSSMVTVTLAPFFALLAFHAESAFVPFIAIAAFVLYQHKDNMLRLIDGSESKLELNIDLEKWIKKTPTTKAKSKKK